MTNQLEIQKNVREHLFNIKKEFEDHISNTKVRFLLTLAWQTAERKAKAQEILKLVSQILIGDEKVDDDKTQLENYKKLYNSWNGGNPAYDGSLDFGGNLLTLKELLDQWENPPKPALTAEQEQKLKDYDEFFKKRPTIKDLEQLDTLYSSLEKERDDYKQENERLRKRQLTDNEQKIILAFQKTISTGNLEFRKSRAKEILTDLEENDLTPQANPNLAAEGISLPQYLVGLLKQFIWICDTYIDEAGELNQEIQRLKDEIENLGG